MINMFAGLKGQGLRQAASEEKLEGVYWEITLPVSSNQSSSQSQPSISFTLSEEELYPTKSIRRFFDDWLEIARRQKQEPAEPPRLLRDALIEELRGFENFEELKQQLLEFPVNTVFWLQSDDLIPSSYTETPSVIEVTFSFDEQPTQGN